MVLVMVDLCKHDGGRWLVFVGFGTVSLGIYFVDCEGDNGGDEDKYMKKMKIVGDGGVWWWLEMKVIKRRR